MIPLEIKTSVTVTLIINTNGHLFLGEMELKDTKRVTNVMISPEDSI